MIKSFLRDLKDPERPLLAPNIWILKIIGLILPESRLGKILYILLHETVAFFVFTQYMELYIIRSDLGLVLTNLRISMLSVVCIVKSNTFVFWQSEWKEVLDYVTAADKEERMSNDRRRVKILNDYTKYSRRMTYNYWFLVFTTFINTIGTPLMGYVSSPSYREKLHNGTELFPHIFSSWMPIDKYHSPGSWITVVWHTLLCAYGGTIMAAYDTNIMVIMVYFGGKLELLRERLKQIFNSDGMPLTDEEYYKRVRELHTTHILILRYSRLFNSMLSPVMFLYVVICSLMLCASTYQLTSETNTAQMVLLAEYLIFGVAQLFIYCWHSNIVLLKSQKVMHGPYESQWWTANVKQRKAIMLLAGQVQISKVFTAGPFTNLTLSTFLTILKGSYSYYTLLRK